jgi:hypothetical protein
LVYGVHEEPEELKKTYSGFFVWKVSVVLSVVSADALCPAVERDKARIRV